VVSVVVPSPSALARPVVEEPAVRADGLCALESCGKPRNPERSARYAREFGERDPFCSMECCRRFYGLKVPRQMMEERQALAAARGARA
jgi:hypothetical protein